MVLYELIVRLLVLQFIKHKLNTLILCYTFYIACYVICCTVGFVHNHSQGDTQLNIPCMCIDVRYH